MSGMKQIRGRKAGMLLILRPSWGGVNMRWLEGNREARKVCGNPANGDAKGRSPDAWSGKELLCPAGRDRTGVISL